MTTLELLDPVMLYAYEVWEFERTDILETEQMSQVYSKSQKDNLQSDGVW